MADSSKNENKSFFYKLVYNDKYLIFFSLSCCPCLDFNLYQRWHR